MVVQETSLLAFITLDSLSNKQSLVYGALSCYGPMTNAEISDRLSWPINTVTPRVLELRKLGHVIDNGIKKCSITGRAAHVWKAR